MRADEFHSPRKKKSQIVAEIAQIMDAATYIQGDSEVHQKAFYSVSRSQDVV